MENNYHFFYFASLYSLRTRPHQAGGHGRREAARTGRDHVPRNVRDPSVLPSLRRVGSSPVAVIVALFGFGCVELTSYSCQQMQAFFLADLQYHFLTGSLFVIAQVVVGFIHWIRSIIFQVSRRIISSSCKNGCTVPKKKLVRETSRYVNHNSS